MRARRGALGTAIVYGNCQGEAIASTLKADAHIAALLKTVYLRSFENPLLGASTLPQRIVGSAVLLWEQHDLVRFPHAAGLRADVLALTFPSMDSNLLFPFTVGNPYDIADREFPHGRFHYADRAIIRAIDRGMNRDDVLEYYLTRWDDYKIDLDRLAQIEAARTQARDGHCDVRIGDVIGANMRTRRLFWTTNHPTPFLLGALVERLLAASESLAPSLADADIEATMVGYFGEKGPLGAVSTPIHPRVAEHLGLEWYDPNERYPIWDGTLCSYEEYYAAMIDWSFRVREMTRERVSEG